MAYGIKVCCAPALAAPFQSFGGVDVFPSLQQKAARLAYGLIKNHPFVDGKQTDRCTRHAGLSRSEWRGIKLYTERTV
ncbi:MAG: Fic family protein [Evtepia sp.]